MENLNLYFNLTYKVGYYYKEEFFKTLLDAKKRWSELEGAYDTKVISIMAFLSDKEIERLDSAYIDFYGKKGVVLASTKEATLSKIENLQKEQRAKVKHFALYGKTLELKKYVAPNSEFKQGPYVRHNTIFFDFNEYAPIEKVYLKEGKNIECRRDSNYEKYEEVTSYGVYKETLYEIETEEEFNLFNKKVKDFEKEILEQELKQDYMPEVARLNALKELAKRLKEEIWL
jgi:hypothetical protein